MIRLFLVYLITFFALSAIAQDTFQLAPPLIKFSSIFFKKEATVSLLFAQPGTNVHYTTNGEEPMTSDQVYRKPIIITKNMTTLKVKAYSSDFSPSATVSTTFIKEGLAFHAIFPPANSKYEGEGPATLNNNKGGIANPNLAHWLGYNGDSVVVSLSIKQEQPLKSVLINAMQNQGGWIFFPSKIEAFAFDKHEDKLIKIGQTVYHPQKNMDDLTCKSILIQLNNISTQQIQLVIHNQKLPLWHSGKGNNGWIFIDEIKLY